ncbi:UNKNOWN [Stylonychia lemnae]|uniref:Uncharacterized protein n=1 Tax=Stylonychia lemnae TaxID=5949 RepID=A0A078ANF5_STYLE|nr:UNKNOWN [Stylonychia lemnae]|eukprot:CDW83870.1 UNKNOWN [Stylonychia lemnae]
MELGTILYPFKSITPALVELFNYLNVETNDYEILVKENTTNYLMTLFSQLIILNSKNITIRTYQSSNISALGAKSTLYILSDKFYKIAYETRFSLINETFNFNNKLQNGKISSDEIIIMSPKAELIIMRSEVKFAFFWEIQSKTITFLVNTLMLQFLEIIECNFQSLWQSDDIFESSQFENREFNIDNRLGQSFSTNDDANKQQLLIDSTSLCPFDTDNKIKKTQFSNIYISSDAHIPKTAIQYQINCQLKSDLGKRNQECIFENITAEHLYSSITLLNIATQNLNVTFSNITNRNVSIGPVQAFHLIFAGTNTIQLIDTKFYDCNTQSRIAVCLVLYNNMFIDNLIMINNTLDRLKNGFCFVKGASNPTTAIQSFNNLYFKGNKVNSNQSNDELRQGSYIIRFDEYTLVANQAENSTFNNISVIGNEVNFFVFSGFKNYSGQILMQAGDVDQFDLPLQVSIISCNFTYNYAVIQSMISVKTNSKLTINNTLFNHTFSYARGSIALADYQNVQITIYNCIFFENTAVDGGLFFIHYGSNVDIYNSYFENNTALIGSIAMIENQGQIKIKDSVLRENHALKSSIIAIIDSSDKTSIFDNCTFERNQPLDPYSYSILVFSQWRDPRYNMFTIPNTLLNRNYMLNEIQYTFSVSKSNFIIKNSLIKEGINFIISYISDISVTNALFENVQIDESEGSFFSLTSSKLRITDVVLRNFTYQNQKITHKQYLIEQNLNSVLRLRNTTITNSNIQIINSINSNLTIINTTISKIQHYGINDKLLKMDSSNIQISTSNFNQIKTLSLIHVQISRSKIVQIFNSNFSDFNRTLLDLSMSNLNIYNSRFYCNSNQTDFDLLNEKRLFESYRSADNRIINQNSGILQIFNSVFSKGYSLISGGAININNANLRIQNNTFTGNVAFDKGGSIFYNKFRPQIYVNNTFDIQNYAPYGKDIAGYPFSIKIESYDTYQLASGQSYNGKIVVSIIDVDQNRISNDNTSQFIQFQIIYSTLNIGIVDPKSKATGNYQIQVQNGIGIFDALTFYSKPGSQNVSFIISSSSIDTDYIQNIFKSSSLVKDITQINKQFVFYDFRMCKSGEVTFNDQCLVCTIGYFSFNGSDDSCRECPAHADCPGGDSIIVNNGFWRSNKYSTRIIKCLYENACVGGVLNDTTVNEYPLCSYGYGGNLCEKCLLIDGIQFTRLNKYECGKCPDKRNNILYISGIFLALIFALGILLWINLRKQTESETSIVLRIILNYVQILTSAAAFNLDWPYYLQVFFGAYQSVGEVAETFISFDCFLEDTGFTQTGASTYYFKTLMIILLPLIMCFIFIVIFVVRNLFKKNPAVIMQRQIIVASIVVLYSLHPTISRMSSSLFFCMELDQNEYWLQSDLQIRCWSSDHIKWSLGIGLSSLLIWTLGIPLAGYIYLTKNKKNLGDKKFFGKFRMMYQGLKPDCYYWEFANILRKTFLVLVNVFLNLYPNIFKALISLIVLAAYLSLQEKLNPYKNPVFNNLERRELITSLITFFGALFFVSSEISDLIQLVVFIVIVLANFWFILLAVYCLLSTIKYPITRKLSIAMGKIILTDRLIFLEQEYRASKRITDAQFKQDGTGIEKHYLDQTDLNDSFIPGFKHTNYTIAEQQTKKNTTIKSILFTTSIKHMDENKKSKGRSFKSQKHTNDKMDTKSKIYPNHKSISQRQPVMNIDISKINNRNRNHNKHSLLKPKVVEKIESSSDQKVESNMTKYTVVNFNDQSNLISQKNQTLITAAFDPQKDYDRVSNIVNFPSQLLSNINTNTQALDQTQTNNNRKFDSNTLNQPIEKINQKLTLDQYVQNLQRIDQAKVINRNLIEEKQRQKLKKAFVKDVLKSKVKEKSGNNGNQLIKPNKSSRNFTFIEFQNNDDPKNLNSIITQIQKFKDTKNRKKKQNPQITQSYKSEQE